MNLTDVEDKTIKRALKEKVPLKQITEKYTKAFFKDLDTLNIERAEVYPKATEHINEMIMLIKILLENELAYKTDDGCVWFKLKNKKDYGKLAHIDPKQLQAGASGRVLEDEYEKENFGDFALWKAWTKQDGEVFWKTELGKGRPGWHIECSAMSMKHLTNAFKNNAFHPENFETIDIHTGAVDNLFPHHEDEIAQSEGVTTKPFVKYWLHAEHLIVNGRKMAKSLGNFYTLHDLLEKAIPPMAIRYLYFSAHYRQKLNFTLKGVQAAQNTLQSYYDFLDKLNECDAKQDNKDIPKLIKHAHTDFENAMDDDLNTPEALAAIATFTKQINKIMNTLSKQDAVKVKDFFTHVDSVLGVFKRESIKIPKEIKDLAKDREKARKANDFKKADLIRDQLKAKGYVLEDTPKGPRIKPL